jgi:hypothetical protein
MLPTKLDMQALLERSSKEIIIKIMMEALFGPKKELHSCGKPVWLHFKIHLFSRKKSGFVPILEITLRKLLILVVSKS